MKSKKYNLEIIVNEKFKQVLLKRFSETLLQDGKQSMKATTYS